MLVKIVLFLLCLYIFKKSIQYTKWHYSPLSVVLFISSLITIGLGIYTIFDDVVINNTHLILKMENVFSNGFDQLMIIIYTLILMTANIYNTFLNSEKNTTAIVRTLAIDNSKKPE